MSDEKNNEERLLQAAEYAFLTKGYAGAKTTEIAAQAGMTHAMLHYYFRTKEQLFNRVVAKKINLLVDMANIFCKNRQIPMKERVRLMVEQHFDILVENPLLPRFIINILNEQPELLKQAGDTMSQLAKEMGASIQEDLDKSAAKGEICRVKLSDLLFNIISVNLVTFMAMPIGKKMLKMMNQDDSNFLTMRREENVKLILKRIEL